jgi:hypothetical protein
MIKNQSGELEAEKDYLIKWMGHGSYTPTWVSAVVMLSPLFAYCIYWLLIMCDVPLPIEWMYIGAGLVIGYFTLLMIWCVGIKESLTNEIGGPITVVGLILAVGFIWMGLR